MDPSSPSRTALATSLMRALHARADPAPVLHDTWGDRLVPQSVRDAFLKRALDQMDPPARDAALAAPGAAVDRMLRANAAYADVVLRARYAEDALQAAVACGIGQYVVLGAGFDSFAWRRPPWAGRLHVYEVDHPATQDFKRQRLAACGLPASDLTHFVPADLAAEDLATALARSPFRSTEPAFFSWLGVTMYLTKQANLATLRAIAACVPAGSELVFSYVDKVVFDPGFDVGDAFRALRSRVASVGESFASGFDPRTLEAQLQDAGFVLLEDLNGQQMAQRYDPRGVNGLRSSTVVHAAHARVAR